MELVTKIPSGKAVIGAREVVKGIKNGKVKRVIVAENCPEFLIERIPSGIFIEKFAGDQKEFAVRLGKPFPIAVAGFEK